MSTSNEKETPKYKFKDIFKLFAKSVREYKKPSILAATFISLETLTECVIPLVMSFLIDSMNDPKNTNIVGTVLMYSGILFGLACLSFIFGITAGKISAKAAVGFSTNLKQDIFYKISSFSFNNIDKFSVSSLVTRQTTDVSYIQMAYMMLIRIALRAPLMLIFSIIMAIIMAAQISWIYAITVPVLALALGLIISIVLPIFTKVFKKYDNLNESVEENVRGIRVVKTYAREDYEKEKFTKASKDIKDGFTKAERIIALTNPVMMMCLYLSMSLIIFIGSLYVLKGSEVVVVDGVAKIEFLNLSVGQLSSLITYGAQILSSLMMLSMVFVMFAMSAASMRRVYEVLIEVPTIRNKEDAITSVKDGSISFKNVDFKYKENAEKFALSNVNLEIKSGETVGIIGGTGASKSTLVNLISRFYDVSDGTVSLGGVNVKDYDLKTLRTNVAMVLQKNILFSGTIKENLLWGNPNASDDEIVQASKIAQADSFVESFPDKYETHIEQGGSNVSGGQKQRLCIARAILKKPKVLILDDSTSAVDTKTDALIREGLKKTLPNTTKIIIAQRVSSVQNADTIIVMDNGTIVGKGNHEELLKSNEIYKEIYDLQNKIGGQKND